MLAKKGVLPRHDRLSDSGRGGEGIRFIKACIGYKNGGGGSTLNNVRKEMIWQNRLPSIGAPADMPLEELCKIVSDIGYDGLELASWGHVDVSRAATDLAYCKEIKDTLAKYDLSAWAIEGHLAGQCVGDVWDSRLDGFAPSEFAGDPAAIRQWGIDEMKRMAHAAKNLDIKIITCFMGSPI